MAKPDGGLITETNRQYYSGAQGFLVTEGQTSFVCTFDTDLKFGSHSPTINAYALNNFVLYLSQTGLPGSFAEYVAEYTVTKNTITLAAAPLTNSFVVVQLKSETGGNYGNEDAFGTTVQENYNNYSYLSVNDVINNFMVAYVGTGKLIQSVKRTDVIFHVKRGLQELSYDTLKSIKSQELQVPASLSVPIPQDYVNYVKCSWVDSLGVKHIIYPTTLTSNPYSLLPQDDDGLPLQDNYDDNLLASQYATEERWGTANKKLINGGFNVADISAGLDIDWWGAWGPGGFYGQRYGTDPETSQVNGWFTINEREGKFSFSSDLVNAVIILEYISDGLAYTADMRIPKLAEDAIYAYVLHAIMHGRMNVPEYIVNRLKKDKSTKIRNTKIRLSNIKLEEITQVMRGKSKWIKH